MSSPNGDHPGFVYVATASEYIERGISKIGFTKNPRSRSDAHRKSSSTAYKLFLFRCWRLEEIIEAQRVETWVKRELRKLGLSCPDSSDFFRIRVSDMCEAVREGVRALRLGAIEEFPADFGAVIEKADDFPCLPRELIQLLSANEANAYWLGCKDTIRILAELEGLRIDPADFHRLLQNLDINTEHNEPTLASTIAGYFRNHSNRQLREIGERAMKQLLKAEDEGFSKFSDDWAIDDWRAKYRKPN